MHFDGGKGLWLLCVGLMLFACGSERKAQEAEDRSRMPKSRKSSVLGSESVHGLEALRDTVLARATRSDTLGLLRLQIDDSVYRAIVYPLSPVYDSAREEVFRFVLDMHKSNSNKGLRRFLQDAESIQSALPAEYEIVAVPDGFMYRNPAFKLTAPGLRVFGSALCLSGKCQVLSYANAGKLGGTGDPEEE